MTDEAERLVVRPYARLFTMLGEQLIKSDRIALVELIKNSYDADASRVWVDFRDFDDLDRNDSRSRITLTDDGDGMTEEIIRDHWLNPATPGKLERKSADPRTAKGRFLQGEKGIGRFAIFKLGSSAQIITRPVGSEVEYVVNYDLSFLDEPPAGSKPLFIDEVPVTLQARSPEVFNSKQLPHGTRIRIRKLRNSWNRGLIERTYEEVARLQPLELAGSASRPDFRVEFLKDGGSMGLRDEFQEKFTSLLEERAVLRISGDFDAQAGEFNLTVNGERLKLSLTSPDLAGLRTYKRYFGSAKTARSTSVESGPFAFNFFVFDFRAAVPTEYKLDPDEKDFVRDHRIYLYRDDVRVLPYGDPDDDWLQLDVIRGTQGADQVLSNDQTVGFVRISQAGNPDLRDKTNREGLIESGRAYDDLVALLQILVAYIRAKPFARYVARQEQQARARKRQLGEVKGAIETLEKDSGLSKSQRAQLKRISTAYSIEREFLEMRATRTEELAGVGLSVEAASHDVIAAADRALDLSRSLGHNLRLEPLDIILVLGLADTVTTNLSFVSSRLQDIEGLFVSTRQRKAPHRIAGFVERVAQFYATILHRDQVAYAVEEANGELIVSTTEATLLQILINFFDNSIYWLKAAGTPHPQIACRIDKLTETLVFADNGPGVRPEDEPFIFEPFYSGKGDSGKGLGLYIARQVATRSGFEVDLISDDRHKLLSGANFIVSFGRGGISD